MIRIAISQEAFGAIASTLPLGSLGYENRINEQGERHVWLERTVADRFRAMRGPGESYSDVILRIAGRADRGRGAANPVDRSDANRALMRTEDWDEVNRVARA